MVQHVEMKNGKYSGPGKGQIAHGFDSLELTQGGLGVIHVIKETAQILPYCVINLATSPPPPANGVTGWVGGTAGLDYIPPPQNLQPSQIRPTVLQLPGVSAGGSKGYVQNIPSLPNLLVLPVQPGVSAGLVQTNFQNIPQSFDLPPSQIMQSNPMSMPANITHIQQNCLATPPIYHQPWHIHGTPFQPTTTSLGVTSTTSTYGIQPSSTNRTIDLSSSSNTGNVLNLQHISPISHPITHSQANEYENRVNAMAKFILPLQEKIKLNRTTTPLKVQRQQKVLKIISSPMKRLVTMGFLDNLDEILNKILKN